MPANPPQQQRVRSFYPSHWYPSFWRWHFYAGILVAPFLLVLAATGLVMLLGEEVLTWQRPAIAHVESSAITSSHESRLRAAVGVAPGGRVVRYREGGPGAATQVTIEQRGATETIWIDPGTARVLARIDDADRLDLLAERVHGTLLAGALGDRLVETAAGLGVLLLVSGLFLWWPRGARVAATAPTASARGRWRNVHQWTGVLLAPVLLFYLVSGMAWTGIWGERLVQAWSTFPATKAAPPGTPAGEHTHGELNAGSDRVVPWGLEQAPRPESSPARGRDLTLDDAITIAQREGIGPLFWVGMPNGRDDVVTVGQTTMGGEIHDPRRERVVHLDRRTGAVLGSVGWPDYGFGARFMTAGIPLHQGSLGTWNRLASAAVCLAVIALAATGPLLWWLRRPTASKRLHAPPRPARMPTLAWVAFVTIGVLFPLAGAAIAVALLLDRVAVAFAPGLRARLD